MKSGKFSDKILYLKIKRKNKDAFIEAHDKYLDDIYRFVFFKVSSKEQAEDITSAVFLKAWNHIQNNSVSDFKTLKALFYKVARNAIIDHYRKKSTQQEVSLQDTEEEEYNVADESVDPEREMDTKINMDMIHEKMFELKDEYREVIMLRYINELSVSEIAKILDKSSGNVRVMIYRAMNALKKIINE